MKLDPDWARSTRYPEKYREMIADVKLNCKTLADELKFAKKYSKSRIWAKNIRLGVRWGSLKVDDVNEASK